MLNGFAVVWDFSTLFVVSRAFEVVIGCIVVSINFASVNFDVIGS